MAKSTQYNQSSQYGKSDDSLVFAHIAIVFFALFGFILNFFRGLWDGVKQLGALPGFVLNLGKKQAAQIGEAVSDMEIARVWQQRDSNS